MIKIFNSDENSTDIIDIPKPLSVHREQLVKAMIWGLEDEFKE